MAEQDGQQGEARNSVRNTFLVATVVSLFCAILVSGASVLLKPKQVENRLFYGGQQTVIQLIESLPRAQSMDTALGNLVIRFVELSTGEYVSDFDPQTFDQEALASDPEWSEPVPADLDIAGIGRREKVAMVYLLMDGGELEYLILPIYGKGMWSTIHAYLALEPDLNTVAGMIIREHGETPGLGDRIENPDWLATWRGRETYRQQEPVIRLAASGEAQAGAAEVDALTGATRSARALVQSVRYWLGEHGYQPYLEKLRSDR